MDQDARVVAPGKHREAKRKGDGISFRQKGLHPAVGSSGTVDCRWLPAVNEATSGEHSGDTAGKARPASPRGSAPPPVMRSSTKTLKATRKKAAPLGGISTETPRASSHDAQVERIADVSVRPRCDERFALHGSAAHDAGTEIRGTPDAQNRPQDQAGEADKSHCQGCSCQADPSAAGQKRRCSEPECAAAAAAKFPGRAESLSGRADTKMKTRKRKASAAASHQRGGPPSRSRSGDL